MSIEDDPPVTVAYTVKELLARIDVKVDALIVSLDRKASQESVDLLATRLTTVESDVNSLKASRSQLLGIVAVVSFVVPIVVALAIRWL